jgi:hypothetical protein
MQFREIRISAYYYNIFLNILTFSQIVNMNFGYPEYYNVARIIAAGLVTSAPLSDQIQSGQTKNWD